MRKNRQYNKVFIVNIKHLYVCCPIYIYSPKRYSFLQSRTWADRVSEFRGIAHHTPKLVAMQLLSGTPEEHAS